jgi:hypothetical protein
MLVHVLAVSALSIKALNYGDTYSNYISNPFHVIFADVSVCSSSSCGLGLLLENNGHEIYYNATDSETPVHEVVCVRGVVTFSTFLCPSG